MARQIMKTISVHEESSDLILRVVNNYPISWAIPFNVFLNRRFFLTRPERKRCECWQFSVCLWRPSPAPAAAKERPSQHNQKATEEVILGAFTGEDCHYCNTTRAIEEVIIGAFNEEDCHFCCNAWPFYLCNSYLCSYDLYGSVRNVFDTCTVVQIH